MAEWTLDRILQQAQKGGVNRQQAEWLVAEVRRLRAVAEDMECHCGFPGDCCQRCAALGAIGPSSP